MTLLLPRKIGCARVGERLGEGGMAFVHRADDLVHSGRVYAAKLLRPEVHGDADLVRRFLLEGEVLTKLKHPSLVEVFAFGKTGSWPYLLLELLPGGSVAACKGEPPAQVIRRLIEPMEALSVAHEAGIVHRDLKPSNLLFTADGRLKVTDFGVCMMENSEGAGGSEGTRLTRSRMVVGTVGFMAPEQHGDPRRVDGRADVYAMGAILYEFTTGQPYAQVMLPPASARPGFPPGLAKILLESLAPDPARRLSSMAQFRERLTSWLETAEAAGWGAEPLPGYGEVREAETIVRRKDPVPVDDSPETRLGPYLDALGTASVGLRRDAAEGLLAAAKMGDSDFLLHVLSVVPETSRFAVAQALGKVGEEPALESLLNLLANPYCQREAAEAAARIALRARCSDHVSSVIPAVPVIPLIRVLGVIREPGLGTPWRWISRALLGDETWVQALIHAWPSLGPTQRLQALEAARELPGSLKSQVKAATTGLSGATRQIWEQL